MAGFVVLGGDARAAGGEETYFSPFLAIVGSPAGCVSCWEMGRLERRGSRREVGGGYAGI